MVQDRSSATAMLAGSDGISITDHVLMLITDELRTANWMRSKDGAKNRNRPKPLSPLNKRGREVRYGHTDADPETAMRMLAKFGPRPPDAPDGDDSN
jgi:hypothetical protein